MSLANRMTILLLGVLGVCGLFAGYGFHQSVQRSLNSELEGRLDARIAWIEASLEHDEAELELEPMRPASNAAEHWRVSTADGRLLWSSVSPVDEGLLWKHREIRIGDEHGPAAEGHELKTRPGRHENDREHEGHGGDEKAAIEYAKFRLPGEDHQAILIFSSGTSMEPMVQELARLSLALWTVGPGVLVMLGGILVVLIRWQLRPLAAMAQSAAGIGPDTLGTRVESYGTSRECVRLSESINGMLDRLADGLEREKRFAANAAHELRTPLAQMRTQVEVALRQDRDAGEYRTSLEESLIDIERLQSLIVGLLQLTRCENRSVQTGEPVSVSTIVHKAVESSDSVDIETKDLPWKVLGDEQLFSSAIFNLIENAHRYAPGEPPTLSAVRENGSVSIVVSDHGPGVQESDAQRIFEPLIRLDTARTVGGEADGFGLGLSVARAAARLYGGDLVCRNRSDGVGGAEFVFSMQIANQVDRAN